MLLIALIFLQMHKNPQFDHNTYYRILNFYWIIYIFNFCVRIRIGSKFDLI